MLLTACSSSPEPAEYEQAIEAEYNKDAFAFADSVGVTVEGMAPPGAVRGVASGAQRLAEQAEAFGGSAAGEAVKGLAQGAAGLASDFGIDGAKELKQGIESATATDWDVVGLTILASRRADDAHVAQIRYDLFANVGGTRKQMGSGITHSIRLSVTPDGNKAVPIS
ncbi:hypothetical protein CHU93_05205 [Sandarakinorhabdus cyanobacteriorum]|uniref:Uncharacterized protein n=1 Tax=Sandarakinorhabdus cyanobacteriorum TaxID=1981098 RepID=A0A255YQZ9_9SPHN|nr:hypothetical protein CHU93_05205 [Sandarakinorhabdus cyanobacteriorum]